MSKDIFAQESKILAEAKTHLSDEPIRSEIYAELVSNYGKLLRTTKKIIKLSDKNEDKLNELKAKHWKVVQNCKASPLNSQNSYLHNSTTLYSLVRELGLEPLDVRS